MRRRIKDIACAWLISSTVFSAHAAFANDITTLKNLENTRQARTDIKAKLACAKDHYALVEWEGANVGGESLYHKAGSKWVFVTGGGGAMDSNALIAFHVPAKTATALVRSLQARMRPGSTSC